MSVAGIIIAGGKGSRLGGREKILLRLNGEPLVEILLRPVTPQVDALALNVCKESVTLCRDWAARRIAILADPPGSVGPLAGLLAGMRWLETLDASFEWLATFASDMPFVPSDLVSRLVDAAQQGGKSTAAVAFDGEEMQCLWSLWPRDATRPLEHGALEGRYRSIRGALVHFGAQKCRTHDPSASLNINTWDDHARAERMLREGNACCEVER